MMFIEGEGGLFRGYSEDQPLEIWHPGVGWKTHKGGTKQRYWGSRITEAEARTLMDDLTKWQAGRKKPAK